LFTTKRTGEGTGLGRSIAHRIVSEYGGALTFASVVGRRDDGDEPVAGRVRLYQSTG
jgi:nitrogen fixation/metabolism regulation signal transduction histidine kinase